MNILLYYQNPYHSVALESLVEYFIKEGHSVYFLTMCKEGILHLKVEGLGGKTDTIVVNTNKLIYYYKHWLFLIKYCKKNKIDIIYSHLQLANLIAIFTQYFIKADVFPCRHHADDVMLGGNRNAFIIDKLVNILSKKIIVVSKAIKKQMVNNENVNFRKIEIIPLGYNFELYDKPDLEEVEKIKVKAHCALLLIVIGRMTKNKRHIKALEVLNSLIKADLDVKMILMDDGPEKDNLMIYAQENELMNRIILTGFVSNIVNYLAASDLLLHPSLSEASNQVVKEAGLLNKPSIVCHHIGDFDEYILHKHNGFLVSTENTTAEMYELVKEYYYKKNDLEIIGLNIKPVIENKFGIDKVGLSYLKLFKRKYD